MVEMKTLTINGITYEVVDETARKNSGANSTVVALTVEGWTEESDGSYSQTVAVPFMTAAAKVVNVDVDKPGTDKDADAEAAAGWALISASTDPAQLDGAMKFYTDEIPTVNVPVKVGVS